MSLILGSILGFKILLNFLFLTKYQILKGSIIDYLIFLVKMIPNLISKKRPNLTQAQNINAEFTIKKFSL